MTNIAFRQFTAGEVVESAGITMSTLQNWIKREVIVGHGDDDIEGGGSQGRHRRFSFHALMQISIGAALIRASGGGDLRQAFNAAMIFAHSGEGPSGWVNAKDEIESGDPNRDPGMPYHWSHGRTLMGCAGDNTTIVLLRPKQDSFFEIRQNLRRAEGFVVLDASAVFERVCAHIGLDYREVLDAAYPTAAS